MPQSKYFAELTPVPLQAQLDDNSSVITKFIYNTCEDTILNAANPNGPNDNLIPKCTAVFENSPKLIATPNSNKIVETPSVLLNSNMKCNDKNNQSVVFQKSAKNKVTENQSFFSMVTYNITKK